MAGASPCDAVTFELLAEVLFDVVPRNVDLAIDDPRAGVRVDEGLLRRRFRPFFTVAFEEDLESVSCLAVQSGWLVLHHERVQGFGEKDRHGSDILGDEFGVASYCSQRYVVVLQQVRVFVLRSSIFANYIRISEEMEVSTVQLDFRLGMSKYLFYA